jgi:hypothetical protein
MRSRPISGVIWRETRARYGESGAFLFSAFTNADALYVPVATRDRIHGVDLTHFGDDGAGGLRGDHLRDAGHRRMGGIAETEMIARAGT